MPPLLRPQRRHTHHAVDDALEQGELFNNLFAWALSQNVPCRAVTHEFHDGPNWLKPLLNPISHRGEQHGYGSAGLKKIHGLLGKSDPTHSFD
jgi:hypothetical protein